MHYAVEQMDHADKWQVIKEAATSASAQEEMRRLLRLSRSTAWRVVERPSGRLILMHIGPSHWPHEALGALRLTENDIALLLAERRTRPR